MDPLGHHAHFARNAAADADPDEVVNIRRDGQFVNAFVLPVIGQMGLHLEPLLARDLYESGWVRIGSDDVALLRIARALEAIAAQNEIRSAVEPSALTPEAARILQEATEIQQRRARTP